MKIKYFLVKTKRINKNRSSIKMTDDCKKNVKMNKTQKTLNLKLCKVYRDKNNATEAKTNMVEFATLSINLQLDCYMRSFEITVIRSTF